MKLKEALEYINFIKIGTDEEMIKAYTIMFREIYGVDIKNEDGTYKSIYDILSEASRRMKGKEFK